MMNPDDNNKSEIQKAMDKSYEKFNSIPQKSNKELLVAIIGIVIVAIGIIVTFVVIVNKKEKANKKVLEQEEVYYGTWLCNENEIELTIDSKNYNMNYSNNTNIEATYVVDSVEKEGKYDKYTLTVNATKRIIKGEEYTSPYTTQYQLAFDEDNIDEMAMINVITYNMYNCSRDSATRQHNTHSDFVNVVGTKELGYIEVPETWKYRSGDNGKLLFIEEDVKGLSVDIEKNTSGEYEEIVENLRLSNNETSSYENVITTRVSEEVESKVGQYDAVLFKTVEETKNELVEESTIREYIYYWIFKTEDGAVRSITIKSYVSMEDVEQYAYLVDSYSITK